MCLLHVIKDFVQDWQRHSESSSRHLVTVPGFYFLVTIFYFIRVLTSFPWVLLLIWVLFALSPATEVEGLRVECEGCMHNGYVWILFREKFSEMKRKSYFYLLFLEQKRAGK
jgi:hypothetical protein